MKANSFSIKARGRSFRYACKGIYKFFSQEPNAWIHVAATAVVFGAAFYFKVTRTEMMTLVIVTGFVWVSEILNTAVERIMDFISPEHHPETGFIKDIAAAAVLLSALTALITGAIVFIPKIF